MADEIDNPDARRSSKGVHGCAVCGASAPFGFANDPRVRFRDGKSSGECWCYQAGPNGETLPCPPVEVTQTIKESQIEITKEPKPLLLTHLQGEIIGSCPHCQTNRVPCVGHCFGCRTFDL
jgi:hypothetical protein